MPGGFGTRGIEGKILAAEWARTAKKPYLGKRHTLLLLCTWLSDFSQVSLCALSAVYCWGPVKNCHNPVLRGRGGDCLVCTL